MPDNKNNTEHLDNSVSGNDQYPSLLSEAEIAALNEIWKTTNTTTTPDMLARNTRGGSILVSNEGIKLEGI